MRSNKLNTLDQNLNILGLKLPATVIKHRKQLTELASIQLHEGNRAVRDVDDIKGEVERRALDQVIARERANQVRLMSDDLNERIDRALISETDNLIDKLEPAVMKAHKTITEAAVTLGEVTAEAAVVAGDIDAYKAAQDAWQIIATASSIREALYTLDRPSFEPGTVRSLTLYTFTTLQAWDDYEALPSGGSATASHATALALDGVQPAWLSTDDAEAQSLRLGKLQAARDRGEDERNVVYDDGARAFRSGSKSWMHA